MQYQWDGLVSMAGRRPVGGPSALFAGTLLGLMGAPLGCGTDTVATEALDRNSAVQRQSLEEDPNDRPEPLYRFTLFDTLIPALLRSSSAALRADTNRDGRITPDDEVDEDRWTNDRGVVLLANTDDDDDDGHRDGLDDRIPADADRLDMVKVVAGVLLGLGNEYQPYLRVEPRQADPQVRIFDEQPDGTMRLLRRPDDPPVDLSDTAIRERDLTLWVEALSGPSSTWDGEFTLTLEVISQEAPTDPLSQDTIALRVSPVVFPDNTRPARLLYVMPIPTYDEYGRPVAGSNEAFYEALVAGLPYGVEIYAVNPWRYRQDRWVQDNMQTGYQQASNLSGPFATPTYLQAQRPTGSRGLESFLPKELLGPDLGYVFPGGRRTSLNYGGNLEVAPPHDSEAGSFPLGRIVLGGGDLGTLRGVEHNGHMSESQLAWLNAQQVQGPALEYSTEWLAVAHIDEYCLFVPDPMAVNDRPWKVLISSPQMARHALLELEQANKGHLPVFEDRGPGYERTVAELLGDSDLMSYNALAQARIDGERERMKRDLGLSERDFIDVPTLYEYGLYYGGRDLGVALNPGVVNLVVVNNTLFVPDPEGPDPGSGDVWKRQFETAVAPLGLAIHYVDVFESYHVLMGESHCGTNVEHEPYPMPWWEVSQ